jgi:hypothetical protein
MTSVPSRVSSPGQVDDAEIERALDEGAGSQSRRPEADRSDVPVGERRPSPWTVVGLAAVLVLPLLVALVALARTRWYPILDLAMTELRVRDVGTRGTPLIGLPGRIGVLGGEQGSHPGPISFWMLAPVYRLLGSSAWSLLAATVALHAAAIGAALFIARRRGGLGVMLGVALLLSLLTRAYGTGTLTEPWNPYMPVLWWVVLMLAVWSVLDRDIKMLPIGVFAGTVAAQTHAPYMVIVLGIGGLGLAAAALHLVRWSSGPERKQVLVWVGVALLIGGILWTPPVYDQLRREPGNISLLIEHFSEPSEDPVGMRLGVEMVLLHLDPWRLLTEQQAATGSLVDASPEDTGSLLPGLFVLVAWAGTVALAWKMRHRALLRLHLVVGVALLLAVVSISRIFGQVWYYLMIWAWGISALLLFAGGWTIAAHVRRRRAGASNDATRRVVLAAVAGATAVSTLVFAVDAASTEVPAEPLSSSLAEVVPDTVDALGASGEPGEGPDGRYLVGWLDAYYMGSQGMGLVNELDREGFDVGVIRPWSVPMTRHRLRTPEEATAFVHLVTGVHVETWRASPGVREVAYHDPRTAAEVAEYEALRDEVYAEVEALDIGREDDVDVNLFSIAIDSRIPPSTQDKMTRLLDLGTPLAVFVGPVEALEAIEARR